MSFLTKLSLKNTVSIIILSVLVLVGGIYSTNQIKVETFPDVSFPSVLVQATYMGASTEEVVDKVTTPLEEGLLQIKDIDNLTSTTSEFASTLFITFPFEKDMEEATVEVEGIISKTKLPENVEVKVQRMSAGATPIYQVAVASEQENLQELIENSIVPQLEQLNGVNSVSLSGLKETKLLIELNKEKASEKGITINQIKDAIESKNYTLPLGSVEEGGTSIPIQLQGKLSSIEDIENITFTIQPGFGAQQQQGQPGNQPQGQVGGPPQGQQAGVPSQPVQEEIKLSDIAEVKTVEEQNQITRFNGQESYILEVMKTQDSNTAEVANEVKAVLADFEEKENLNLYVVLDQGKEVEKSVSTLVKEGLFGALFTVLVILVFLRNIRATFIAILSLPLSIFTTIAVLDQMGLTLNIMTLGGLAVSIGRIVDDSIVIIENIYRWKQKKDQGLKNKELVFKATKEVLSPVASSTIATVVVFLPLAFVGGIIGEFFRPFAVAVVVSILASLFVAMMLIPVLGSIFFKNVKHVEKEGRFIRGFERLIRGSLKKKWLDIASSIVILIGSLGIIPLLGVSFLPTGTEPTVEVDVELPETVHLKDTDQLVTQVENYLAEVEGIDYSRISIGISNNRGFGGGNAKENMANIFIQFESNDNIETRIASLNEDISEIVTKRYPDAQINTQEVAQQGPPSGNNIEINLFGDKLEDLQTAAQEVEELFNSYGELKNVSNNLNEVQPKWVVSINEEGKDANVSPFQVMDVVNKQLRPTQLGVYELEKEEWNLSIFYDEEVSSKEELENIEIVTAAGVKKLSEIVEFEETVTPTTISHQVGRMNAKVTADTKGEHTAALTQEIEKELENLDIPSSVEVQVGGGLEMITEGFADLGLAMVIAVGLVFLVLSMAFGGIKIPLVILTSLIFVPVGSLGGLLLSGETLSMSAMIGMLMLIGIVVTNAIVLLQRVEENRMDGMEMTEALVEASKTRLRPILMTAFATIFALVPLAISTSTSGLISKGLAITVIGGLTTSTILTLIVVPTIYSLIAKNKIYEKLDLK